jgi:hypothetical protein
MIYTLDTLDCGLINKKSMDVFAKMRSANLQHLCAVGDSVLRAWRHTVQRISFSLVLLLLYSFPS